MVGVCGVVSHCVQCSTFVLLSSAFLERERERHTHTDTERERQRQRQRDRETERIHCR